MNISQTILRAEQARALGGINRVLAAREVIRESRASLGAEAPEHFRHENFSDFLSAGGVMTWQVLFVIVCVGMLFALKRKQWGGALVAFMLSGLMLGAAIVTHERAITPVAVVGVLDELRAGPSAEYFEVLARVKPCTVVQVEKTVDEYTCVITPQGRGWIKTASLVKE